MKRLVIASLMGLFCCTAFAQQHLSFCEIPITGRSYAFVDRMKSAGFTHLTVESTRDFNTFRGTYEEVKECRVVAHNTRNTRTVVKIEVNHPLSAEWVSLKEEYTAVVAAYTEKYGKPEISLDGFTAPYSEGDGNELKALAQHKAMFETRYQVENGTIDVVLVPDGQSAAHLMIVFADAMGQTQWLSENDDDDE